MAFDFDTAGLIKDVILPQLEDARFVKPYAELVSNFTEDNVNTGGPTWNHQIETSSTSNARNFTKADVDPQAGSFQTVLAYWNFVYQETAAEVFNIDINQAANGGIKGVEDLLTKAISDEMDGLWELIYDDVYAQIKLDLTAAGTYSDAALNRGTYPVLAPYNELTNTQITVPLMRGCQYNTQLNKSNTGGNGAYTFVMESAVKYALQPQVALLNTWNQQNNGNQPVNGGYAPIADFEGSAVVSPQAMTTGDVFFVRKQDVQVKKHRALTMVPVPSGRDSIKVIIRTGINARVVNVGKQGMMTLKD